MDRIDVSGIIGSVIVGHSWTYIERVPNGAELQWKARKTGHTLRSGTCAASEPVASGSAMNRHRWGPYSSTHSRHRQVSPDFFTELRHRGNLLTEHNRAWRAHHSLAEHDIAARFHTALTEILVYMTCVDGIGAPSTSSCEVTVRNLMRLELALRSHPAPAEWDQANAMLSRSVQPDDGDHPSVLRWLEYLTDPPP